MICFVRYIGRQADKIYRFVGSAEVTTLREISLPESRSAIGVDIVRKIDRVIKN